MFSIGGYIERTLDEKVENPYLVNSDQYWMFEAIIASMEEVGKASPNPTVGCVFVKDGKLLSRGATQEFGALHGERYAANKLKDSSILSGSTAYVTLEPCSHFGKQPPCSQLLIDLKVSRVVIAMLDPFSKVNGEGVRRLKLAGIDVTIGVLEEECRKWHLPFLLHIKKKSPIIIGKWAQTLDAHLADDFYESKWITGTKARAVTHWLRQKYDVICVGSNTVIEDAPRLNTRDCAGPYNRQPVKAIFDPSSRLYNLSNDLVEKLRTSTFSPEAEIIYMGSKKSAQQIKSLYQLKDFEFIDWNRKSSISEFEYVIAKAYENIKGKALQSIFIEGGAKLHAVMMSNNMYDLLHVFINPSVLGATKNRISRSINDESVRMGDKLEYQTIGTHNLDNDILIEAKKKD